MKKTILLISLIPILLLAGCQQNQSSSSRVEQHSSSTKTKKTPNKIPKKDIFKPNIHKKYKGFKLANVPTSFQGTWYRGNPYDKKISKLVITTHLVNDSVVYQQTDPNLKLNHNSTKQNKEYAGDASVITILPNQIKIRGFLDIVDLVYTLSNFKGHPCLYLSYGTNPKAVNGCIFKDKKTALKYRKYDFSKIKLN